MRKILKTSIIYSIIINLVVMPAYSIQDTPNDSSRFFNTSTAPARPTAVGMGLGLVINTGTQILRNQAMQEMQRAAAIRQAQLMGQLVPPNQSSELFPSCVFPDFPSPMPQECPEVKMGPRVNPQSIGPIIGIHEGTANAIKFHKKQIQDLLLPDNKKSPFGCFDKSAESIDLQFKTNIEQMENLKTTLKIKTEKIIAAMDLQKKRVKNIHQVLNGGGEGELDNQANPVSDFFKDSACGVALNQDALGSARGLIGVGQILSGGKNGGSVNTKAGNFIRNNKKIKKDLQKVTSTIRDRLLEFTKDNRKFQEGRTDLASDIEDALKLSKVGLSGLTQFGGLEAALSEQSAVLQTKMKRAGKFTDLTRFEDQFLSKCLSGEDGSGNGLSADNIIKGLSIPDSIQGGNLKADMEAALKTALNAKGDENTPDHLAKLAAINDFEAAFPGTQIRFRDSSTSREVSESPKKLFARTSNSCRQHFESSAGGRTKYEELRRNNSRLIKSQRDFILNSPNAIYDSIMKCDSNPDGGSPGSCSEGKAFDTRSPSFCFPAAEKCASAVKKCDTKIKNVIKKKQNELAKEADRYNAQYKSLINTQNSLLKLVNQSVNQSRNLLVGLTKTLGKAPKDLFIATPQLGNSAFGVELLGDGQLPDINALPAKIDEIKKGLEGHLKAAQQEIKKERDQLKARLEAMIAEYEKVENSCKKNVDGFNQAMDQMAQQQQQQIQEALKKQAEMSHKVMGLCAKAKNLFSGGSVKPVCNNAAQSLAEEISEITVQLNPTLKAVAGTIHATCGDKDSESSKNKVTYSLSGLCAKTKGKEPFNALTEKEKDIMESELNGDKLSSYKNLCPQLIQQANNDAGCHAKLTNNTGDDGSPWYAFDETKDRDTTTVAAGNGQPKVPGKKSTCDTEKFKEVLKSPTEELQQLQLAYAIAKSGQGNGDLSKIGEILAGGTCEGQSRDGRTGADSMLGQMQRNPNLPITGLDGAVK